MLTLTRRLLKVLLLLSPLLALVFLLSFVATWFAPDFIEAKVGFSFVTGPEKLWEARVGLLWILMMFGLAIFVLHRLLLIVTTASEGDPFVAVNTDRLRQIGLALLGIELVRWLGALVLWLMTRADFESYVEPSLEITPWLAILLAFVLARVFEVGTRLRDDVALTV